MLENKPGFETIRNTAFGLYSTNGGIIFFTISEFLLTKSNRVSPFLCRAPTVTITTFELLDMQKSIEEPVTQ